MNDPDRLWRRLGCIAFEDVGLADIATLGLVTSALAGKRIRADLGGEWAVASWLVQRLCDAHKCRMTDDLLMATQAHPALTGQHEALPALSHDQLRRVILGDGGILERATAMIYLAGTEARAVPAFRPRRGEPALEHVQAKWAPVRVKNMRPVKNQEGQSDIIRSAFLAFHVAEELGACPTIIAISREGYRRTREALCLLLPLLDAEPSDDTPAFMDDPLPPEAMAGPVPGWVLDAYTREGKAALRRFLGTQAGLAVWARRHLPAEERLPLIPRVLFHVEGGLLINRRRTALSDALRRINEEEASGVSPEAMREAMALMQADLPILNAIRTEIMGGNSHA